MYEWRKICLYQPCSAQQVALLDVLMRIDGHGHICGIKPLEQLHGHRGSSHRYRLTSPADELA
jgi:hypothetical protein